MYIILILHIYAYKFMQHINVILDMQYTLKCSQLLSFEALYRVSTFSQEE